ncbi:MAG: hypothetical protein ACEY3J_01625 [Arsenophonus sp.]
MMQLEAIDILLAMSSVWRAAYTAMKKLEEDLEKLLALYDF